MGNARQLQAARFLSQSDCVKAPRETTRDAGYGKIALLVILSEAKDIFRDDTIRGEAPPPVLSMAAALSAETAESSVVGTTVFPPERPFDCAQGDRVKASCVFRRDL